MKAAEPTRLADDVLPSTIPDKVDKSNPTKRLAEDIAMRALTQGLTLKTISTVKGFAEGEGLIGVTKEVAALAMSYLQREYKSRAELDEEEEKEKGPSIATQIVEMILESDMKLFCDDGGKPYAWILWKCIQLGAWISPLHGRFPVVIAGIAEEQAIAIT